MTVLRDKFFLASYGKYAAAAVLGLSIAAAIGVPVDTAVKLAAGAMLGFPAAYSFAMRRPSEKDLGGTPSP